MLSIEQVHPKAKEFRYRPLANFNLLEKLFSTAGATGRNAHSIDTLDEGAPAETEDVETWPVDNTARDTTGANKAKDTADNENEDEREEEKRTKKKENKGEENKKEQKEKVLGGKRK
jgi:uncharacterized membrane protein YukC